VCVRNAASPMLMLLPPAREQIFNTNNLYMKCSAIKRVLDNEELDLEIIVNDKVTPSGEPVIQLETAIGAAIKHFKWVACLFIQHVVRVG
jgi:UDP-N-acetylglucosamine pyrophosphorylase